MPGVTTAISRSRVPKACEKCAAPYMERVGFGTERVEAEVQEAVSRRRAWPASIATRCGGRAAWSRCSRKCRRPRSRRADRHADDRQGPRLSRRDAGRRDFRGRRAWASPISAPRAHVSVADAGRRPRRPRRAARSRRSSSRCCRTTTRSRSPARRTTATSTTRKSKYRRAMRYPPQVAMVNVVVRGRTFDEAMDGARDARRCCPRVEGLRDPRPGAGAVDQTAGRTPRAVLPEGDEPQGDARGAAARGLAQADTRQAHLDRRRSAVDALTRALTCTRGPVTNGPIGSRREAQHQNRPSPRPPAPAGRDRAACSSSRRGRMTRAHRGDHRHQESSVHAIQLDDTNVSTIATPTMTSVTIVDAAAEHRVGDVAAVELGDRKEVQRGGQQSEPCRERHRVHVDRIAVGDIAPDQPRRERKSSGSPSSIEHRLNPPAADRRATASGPMNERRHRDDEAGQRPGDADVEQRDLVGDARLDADERAERAGQRQRRRQEIRPRRVARRSAGTRRSGPSRGSREWRGW